MSAKAAEAGWRWDKGVCRMCGTGCGIQIATQGGRVVAVKGDPASPVNRGLLCAKGYALPQVPYAADRLTCFGNSWSVPLGADPEANVEVLRWGMPRAIASPLGEAALALTPEEKMSVEDPAEMEKMRQLTAPR